MKIILDTHIFLWWGNEPTRLSSTAWSLCHDPENDLVLSVASIWEIQLKVQLGKLTIRLPLANLIEDEQEKNGIEVLDIKLSHVLELNSLPLHHKDPFDRLLIAQANAEGIALLSADPMFGKYSVNLLT